MGLRVFAPDKLCVSLTASSFGNVVTWEEKSGCIFLLVKDLGGKLKGLNL